MGAARAHLDGLAVRRATRWATPPADAEEARDTWAAVARAVARVRAGDGGGRTPPTRRWPASSLGDRIEVRRPRPSTTPGCATSGRPSWSAPTGTLGRGRLGVQRLGGPAVGHLGPGHPDRPPSSRRVPVRRASRRPWSTRAVASTSTAWAPCCSPRPCSSTRAATPGSDRADVEAEMARTIGATTCIWLPRGLTRDYDEFGTRGHVDIVATFAVTGRRAAALAGGPGPPRPRGRRSSSRGCCRRRVTPAASCSRSSRVPAPTTLEDDAGPGRLVATSTTSSSTTAWWPAPSTTPRTTDSLALLERAYPGRRVVGVDARPLFARGGGIHCITQQQPRV